MQKNAKTAIKVLSVIAIVLSIVLIVIKARTKTEDLLEETLDE